MPDAGTGFHWRPRHVLGVGLGRVLARNHQHTCTTASRTIKSSAFRATLVRPLAGAIWSGAGVRDGRSDGIVRPLAVAVLGFPAIYLPPSLTFMIVNCLAVHSYPAALRRRNGPGRTSGCSCRPPFPHPAVQARLLSGTDCIEVYSAGTLTAFCVRPMLTAQASQGQPSVVRRWAHLRASASWLTIKAGQSAAPKQPVSRRDLVTASRWQGRPLTALTPTWKVETTAQAWISKAETTFCPLLPT